MKTMVECNEILKEGFPSDESILKDMPFGNSMFEAFSKSDPTAPKDSNDPDDSYLHRRHLKAIMKAMNLLLAGNVRNIIKDQAHADRTVMEWLQAWQDINGTFDAIPLEEQMMWRLEAFLHDVGKSLTSSKHPTRGQYLITQLKTEERDDFVTMLSRKNGRDDREEGRRRFDQIEKVVGFHDRFGVLSTGEASLGILADTVERGLKEEEVEKARRVISHIMVLNLIDIDASVPWGLVSKKVDIVLRDWRTACWEQGSPLIKSRGDRVAFAEGLLGLAARDDRTIERIVRLMNESYLRARSKVINGDNSQSSQWPLFEPTHFRPNVQRACKPLEITWDDFRTNFAHVVKMDYLLYFTEQVIMIGRQLCKMDDDALACVFVMVIKKLVDQFTNLIKQPDKKLRVGVDLSVLRETADVQHQIARLLCGTAAQADLGLEWLAHEASAWPFV